VFQKDRFNQKKPKNGVAAVRAMGAASDARRKFPLHPLKRVIRPGHDAVVWLKQV